ncbi:MAG: FAD-binding oxidoreductase [Planctomycetaceae bacterium]|nr:FAD-binding oxidoreductase [Planctomycetaceae bacterium]
MPHPNSSDEQTHPIAETIRKAVAEGRKVQLVRSAGGAADGIPIAIEQFRAVVDYPARDMTITVESGLTVSELAGILRAESQQLPIDPCSPDQTIGGLVAGNDSGPRRFGYGTMRDYLIGVEAIDGRGRVFHAGGRVVKNVAGYDLCRLLTGSRGSLAVISRVTLKVKPLPVDAAIATFAFTSYAAAERALELLNLTASSPVILDVMNASAATRLLSQFSAADAEVRYPVVLVIGWEGSESSVAWQVETVRTELQDLTDQVHVQTGTAAVDNYCERVCGLQQPQDADTWLFQTRQLPSTVISTVASLESEDCEVFGRAGNGDLFIRSAGNNANGNYGTGSEPGSQRVGEQLVFEQLQSMLSEQQGALFVRKSRHCRTPLPDPQTLTLCRRLKEMFDPAGILNSLTAEPEV